MLKEKITMVNECYDCKNGVDIKDSCYLHCKKPDKFMNGNESGIRNGWFDYPNNFDPVWKLKDCDNFEEK